MAAASAGIGTWMEGADPCLEDQDVSEYPADAAATVSLLRLPSKLIPANFTRRTTDKGPITLQRVFAAPMLLTCEKFLTADECAGLISEAENVGFEPSGANWSAGQSHTTHLPRTLSKARTIRQRAAEVVGVDASWIEMGPVLKYFIGRGFGAHYDCHGAELAGESERRVTFFIPLSSAPSEDGGHTKFTVLAYRFPPTAGSAIIWRNYMPLAKNCDFDRRMKHEGEPPNKGTKYAITMWIHAKPFYG